MRVLFIAYRDFRNPAAVGGDFYLWELARGLSRIGHKVSFVCSRFERSLQREIVDGVEIIRIRGNLGLPARIFHEYFRRLRGEFDVVVEEAIGGQRPPFLAGLYIKEPLISVWHQRNARIFREQYPFPIAVLLSIFELFVARLYRGRCVVTPSKGARKELLRLGFKRENVKPVYDGVGKMFNGARTNLEREDVIVCLGKLRRYKRFDHAILALKRVLDLGKRSCKLVIAGKVSEIDMRYVDELRELASKLGVSDFVEFKLNIPEKEKLKLLENAKVLVQPSPVEGFSIVVAEANKCGTPVVVSDGVPSDVVVHGHNGVVYPFGDIESFSRALMGFLDDKNMWAKVSENSVAWAEKFTWEASTNSFCSVLVDTCA